MFLYVGASLTCVAACVHAEHGVASAGGKANGGGDGPPPPMNFNYDDYRALPRSDAPSPDALNRVAAVQNADENGVSSPPPPPPTVFFLEDAVRVGESLPLPRPAADATAAGAAAATALPPLRLYTVRSVRAIEGPASSCAAARPRRAPACTGAAMPPPARRGRTRWTRPAAAAGRGDRRRRVPRRHVRWDPTTPRSGCSASGPAAPPSAAPSPTRTSSRRTRIEYFSP